MTYNPSTTAYNVGKVYGKDPVPRHGTKHKKIQPERAGSEAPVRGQVVPRTGRRGSDAKK